MDLGSASVPALLRRLELGLLADARPHLHGHTSQPRAMRRTALLEGHTGCVNRLALSEHADLLLSGSDDCTLRVWDLTHPYHIRPRAVISPGHFSNVFGVAFMPNTDSAYVVSAGLDRQVRHTSVVKGLSATLWDCHRRMVKTVSPVSSSVFVTASEDGTARQFDAREPPHTARSSHVLVRIMQGRTPLRLMSAVVSPASANHVLVAADDAHIRVFDRRCGSGPSPVEAAGAGSAGHCVRKMAPPHLQDNSPEDCLFVRSIAHVNYATHATYSSDGQHVVASYYDDRVHVFDLSETSSRTTPSDASPRRFYNPFMSRRAAKIAIWHFGQDAANAVLVEDFTYAIGRANRVLELDPHNIPALLYKSHALLRRESSCDFRNAHKTLCMLIDLVQQDATRIISLWGTESPTGPSSFIADSASCANKAEIWLMIFKYMKACALHRMVLPTSFDDYIPPRASENEHRRRRLQHLDVMCHELEQFRDSHSPGSHDDWKVFVHTRAMGNAVEVAHLFATNGGEQRGKVLAVLRSSFIKGIASLRALILSGVSRLLSDKGSVYHNCSSDSDASSSSDTDECPPEDDYGVRSVLLEGRRQFSSSDAGEGELWGPRPMHSSQSYHGNISLRTDIKEASFYGSKNQIVLSGSDDGHVFMWSARSGELLARVPGDESIVNAVLGHPYHPIIFCSGIDDTIKVWTPEGDIDSVNRPFDVGRTKEDTEMALKQRIVAWQDS